MYIANDLAPGLPGWAINSQIGLLFLTVGVEI